MGPPNPGLLFFVNFVFFVVPLLLNHDGHKGHKEPHGQASGSTELAEVSSPHDVAAWSACARVLLNLDEFITRE